MCAVGPDLVGCRLTMQLVLWSVAAVGCWYGQGSWMPALWLCRSAVACCKGQWYLSR